MHYLQGYTSLHQPRSCSASIRALNVIVQSGLAASGLESSCGSAALLLGASARLIKPRIQLQMGVSMGNPALPFLAQFLRNGLVLPFISAGTPRDRPANMASSNFFEIEYASGSFSEIASGENYCPTRPLTLKGLGCANPAWPPEHGKQIVSYPIINKVMATKKPEPPCLMKGHDASTANRRHQKPGRRSLSRGSYARAGSQQKLQERRTQ